VKSEKKAGFDAMLSRIITGIVLLLCLFAATMMLSLHEDSLKVDAVYQKF
jgi:hypothetical protein